MTRILLVDDQALVRVGFRTILESEPGFEVVGEAADGRVAIEQCAALRPDVVCMDVQMPLMDGLEATRLICAETDGGSGATGPAVMILTTFDRDDFLFEALDAGASGFLLKTAEPEQLIEAVHALARGDALLSPEVTRRVIERFAVGTPGHSAPQRSVEVEALTEREREVLLLLARGCSNAEMATELFLGEATIKTHVSNVLAKLGVRDRIHAVIWAYEHGVVSPAG